MGALGLGLLAALAWGLHDILVRYVSNTMGILVSLFSVLMFGIVAQLPLALTFSTFEAMPLEAVHYSVAAGCVFAAACIGHYQAFGRGPVRLVAPVIGCYSVLAFIIAAATGADVSPAQWLMLGLLIVGITLVAREAHLPDAPKSEGKLITLLYCVLALVGFAVTFALGHRASAIADPILSGLVTRVTTSVIIGGVLAAALARGTVTFVLPRGKGLATLFLMGVLDATALGVVLAAGVFARPEFASAGSSIFGLVTVVLAWAFLKERISGIQWLGVGCVFAAIAYLATA